MAPIDAIVPPSTSEGRRKVNATEATVPPSTSEGRRKVYATEATVPPSKKINDWAGRSEDAPCCLGAGGCWRGVCSSGTPKRRAGMLCSVPTPP